MKVGDIIWKFDGNFLVYPKDEQGKTLRCAPIYREYWRKAEIIGETSRSWIIGYAWDKTKVPKKGEHSGFAFTQFEVDENCYVNENRHKIVREIVRINDAATLRLIADAIGYKADK